jgi:hypothetical protein
MITLKTTNNETHEINPESIDYISPIECNEFGNFQIEIVIKPKIIILAHETYERLLELKQQLKGDKNASN